MKMTITKILIMSLMKDKALCSNELVQHLDGIIGAGTYHASLNLMKRDEWVIARGNYLGKALYILTDLGIEKLEEFTDELSFLSAVKGREIPELVTSHDKRAEGETT